MVGYVVTWAKYFLFIKNVVGKINLAMYPYCGPEEEHNTDHNSTEVMFIII